MNEEQVLNLALYRKVYLIRSAEKAIIKHYGEDDMKTPMHMSMGEEAITAGVTHALGDENQAFGYYRSHALYLAKTGETDKFFAEMYGKVTGAVHGKGGSMHLASVEHGLMNISAVVASTIAPAIGAAFANKMKQNGKIVASFFGDGAMEEGVTLESLNAACLWRLPIIFVCEDNGLAVDVVACDRQGFRSIPDLAQVYQCSVLTSDSTDPETIYHTAMEAISMLQATGRPVFLHLQYYRMLQHIGIISDFDDTAPRPKGGFEKTGYRSRQEYDRWMEKDPVLVCRTKLRTLGINDEYVQHIESIIDAQVAQSIQRAKAAPFPEPHRIGDHVYAPAKE